jgi:tight adherence protein B
MISLNPDIAPWVVFVALVCISGSLMWVVMRLMQWMGIGKGVQQSDLRLALRDGFDKTPSNVDNAIIRLVNQSGLPINASSLLTLSFLVCVLAGASVFVFIEDIPLALITILATFGTLVAILLVVKERRRAQVRAQLPSAIDMIARSLQAGDGLQKSLQSTARRLKGPLHVDLESCSNQIAMGLPVKKALRQLDDRSELFELRMFSSALIINQDTGGNLSHMLERLARVLHDRQEYRRQVSAGTSTARLAAIIIGLAGPALLVYYAFEKDYFGSFWKDESAQFYMLLAIGLEIVGVFWLFALAKNEL